MTESNARALLDEWVGTLKDTSCFSATLGYVQVVRLDNAIEATEAAYEAGRLAVLEQMKTKDVQYKPFQDCDWLIEGAYDQDGNSPRFYADDAELLAYLDAQEGV